MLTITPRQVTISYHPGDARAMPLRNRLLGEGFQVWMDMDFVRESAVDQMGSAIATSIAVVILACAACVGNHGCKLEAEFALRLKKRVVLVMVGCQVREDDWLGRLAEGLPEHQFTLAKDADECVAALGL